MPASLFRSRWFTIARAMIGSQSYDALRLPSRRPILPTHTTTLEAIARVLGVTPRTIATACMLDQLLEARVSRAGNRRAAGQGVNPTTAQLDAMLKNLAATEMLWAG